MLSAYTSMMNFSGDWLEKGYSPSRIPDPQERGQA
jgi:hypothetical protein